MKELLHEVPDFTLYALSALAADGYVKTEKYDFPKHIEYRFPVAFPQHPREEDSRATPGN
jgi:hypothetical protein